MYLPDNDDYYPPFSRNFFEEIHASMGQDRENLGWVLYSNSYVPTGKIFECPVGAASFTIYAKNSKGEVFPHKRPILTISFTIRRMDIIGFMLAGLPELVQ